MGLLERVVLPAARAFEPELVLVSAGFDAHEEDPLADCRLQTGSFVRMAAAVREQARAAGIPVGLVLEGGYNRRVLAECVCAILPVLAGERLGAPAGRSAGRARAPRPSRRTTSSDRASAAQVGRYWQL